jgi:hypothetical protein
MLNFRKGTTMARKTGRPSGRKPKPTDPVAVDPAVRIETIIDRIVSRHPRLKAARESQQGGDHRGGEFAREALATFRDKLKGAAE